MLTSQQTRIVEKELTWYFCHSESDCGIKSNFQAMVNVSLFGVPSCAYSDPYDSYMLKMIGKRRDVDKIIAKLPKTIYKILVISFSDIQFDPYVLKMFRGLVGVAYLCGGRKIEKLCQRFYLGQCDQNEIRLISEIRNNSRSKYQKAIETYLKAKEKYEQEQK